MSWPRVGFYPPTQKGLARYVADRTGMDIRITFGALNAVADFISLTVMEQGNELRWTGLGRFQRRWFAKRLTGIPRPGSYRLHLRVDPRSHIRIKEQEDG